MTTKDIKSEIQKTLENIPEDVLQDILEYLRAFENKTPDQINLGKHLREILSEDKELLQRLAK